jgi:hypothetical protein
MRTELQAMQGALLGHFFESFYLVMQVSDSNDKKCTRVLQTVPFVNFFPCQSNFAKNEPNPPGSIEFSLHQQHTQLLHHLTQLANSSETRLLAQMQLFASVVTFRIRVSPS